MIEDAAAGIEAAHRAQMRVVGVGTPGGGVRADRWVTGLDDLSVAALRSLVEAP